VTNVYVKLFLDSSIQYSGDFRIFPFKSTRNYQDNFFLKFNKSGKSGQLLRPELCLLVMVISGYIPEA